MSCYLIGYDLNKADKDYSGLINAIKGLSGTWWNQLDSTWLVSHPGSAEYIRNTLAAHIDANDELLVVALNREAAWRGFDQKGSDWLKANL